MRSTRRGQVRALATLLVLAALAGLAVAHSGSLGGAARDPLAVPPWLFLSTGGGVVGASFLLASFVTDRRFVTAFHRWGRRLPAPGRAVTTAARVAAVVVLALTLYLGFAGPDSAYRNAAVLVVWVGWWSGYAASTYLLGNTWPTLNPFRAVAEPLPSLDLPYPERLGAWPSVAGLLALIWVEVITPLADEPRLLAAVVAAYTAVTVAGAVAFGTDRWFASVDPVARVFRYYGRVAPLARTDDSVRLRLPGMSLAEARLVGGADEVAFVVALLFVTTYDGFVATGLWASAARTAVGAGVPPLAVYLGAYLGGFALFLGGYRLSALAARRAADTFRSVEYLAVRFAPPLVAIAAGYHLAHNLGSFLLLSPTLLVVAANPFDPPQNPPQLAGLPSWFGGLEIAFVLAGHLVAVWVAHAVAYDVFPDRRDAIRSQYGVTLVMVSYTMVSLWIVTQPYVAPPFLS